MKAHEQPLFHPPKPVIVRRSPKRKILCLIVCLFVLFGPLLVYLFLERHCRQQITMRLEWDNLSEMCALFITTFIL